jgi:hypothetical protein
MEGEHSALEQAPLVYCILMLYSNWLLTHSQKEIP